MKRCFVIGNGPSLSKTPLIHLQKEVTFATNRINRIYKLTDWRPTYYVRTEELLGDYDTFHKDVKENLMQVTRGFLPKDWAKWYGEFSNIEYISTCSHHKANFNEIFAPHEWHLPQYCSFGSSLNVAIQIAVQKGFDVIYLLGVDLDYKDQKTSHFYDDDEEELARRVKAKYANYNMLLAHMIAARNSPIPIYNASIGGVLEVYPRINLEEILCQ